MAVYPSRKVAVHRQEHARAMPDQRAMNSAIWSSSMWGKSREFVPGHHHVTMWVGVGLPNPSNATHQDNQPPGTEPSAEQHLLERLHFPFYRVTVRIIRSCGGEQHLVNMR
jgi:hypothetical protein